MHEMYLSKAIATFRFLYDTLQSIMAPNVSYLPVMHVCVVRLCLQEFMSSEGIELSAREPCPSDPYTTSRQQPLNAYSTPSDNDKLKQFLELDRKVLCFHCLWDDRDSMFGEIRPYVCCTSVVCTYICTLIDCLSDCLSDCRTLSRFFIYVNYCV